MDIKRRILPAVVAAAGIDTDKDPKILSDANIRVQDISFRRAGAMSKRWGWDETSQGFPADAYMASYKDRAIVWGENLRVWDGDAFDDTGETISPADAEVLRIEALGNTIVLQHGMAELGSIRVICWVGSDDDGIQHYVATYDTDTGLLIERYEVEDAFSLSMIWPIATTTDLLYFYCDSDGALKRGTVNTTTGAVAAATIIDSSWPTVATTPVSRDFDHAYIGGSGDYVALAWISDKGIHDGCAVCGTLTGEGTVEGYAVQELEDGKTAGVFKYGTGVAAFSYYDSYNSGTEFYIGVRLIDGDCSDHMSELVIKYWTDANQYPNFPLTGVAGGEYGGAVAGTGHLYYEWSNDGNSYPRWGNSVRRTRFEYDGSSSGYIDSPDSLWLQGVHMAARPWRISDTRHAMVVCPAIATPGDQDQLTYILAEEAIATSDMIFPARWLLGEATPLAPGWTTQRSWENSVVRRMCLASYHANDTQGLSLTDLCSDFGSQWRTAIETLDHLVFPGSVSLVWTGQELVEQGFLMYPHRIDSEQVAGAGLDVPSTYGYVATYERYDSRGNLWQSAPSPVLTHVTNTGYAQAAVYIPPLAITTDDAVQAVLWRTEGYGTVYRRAGSTANDPTAAYLVITDSLSDDSLSDEQLLYTQPPGDVLEDIAPPPTRVAAVHQNRLFVVNREQNATEIQYSKAFEHGHGIRHSDFLTIDVSAHGGEITALRSYLDRLIIFKRDSVWQCYGTGRSATGTGQGYTEPSLVHPSIGCVDQKTIIETPQGLMFLASDGRIWLLDRSLQMSSVGDGVAHWTLTAGRDVRKAAAVPEQDEAVWMSSDGSGLVFNWKYGLWSTWSGMTAIDGTVAKPRPAAGPGEPGGDPVLWWRCVDSCVRRMTPGVFVRKEDGIQTGDPLPSLMETGWFAFAGISGFKRIKRIIITGQMPTDASIIVRIAYDYDPNWIDEQTFDADSNLLAFGVEQTFNLRSSRDPDETDQACVFEVAGSRQKCSAIRLQISDADISSSNSDFVVSGCGFELSAIAFEVGIKEGPGLRTGLRSETRRTPGD